MGEETKIQWTDHTFNPWRGCSKVSKGCANCYADTQAKRNSKTLGIWGPQGTRVVASEAMWREPLKWDRQAKADGVRRRVFCASMADVFEDWDGPMHDSRGGTWSIADAGHRWNYQHETTDDDWGARDLTMADVRQRLFRLIDATPNLDWLLLTKRPENIMAMIPARWRDQLPDNVWVGTSVEDQETADVRIPHLLKVPAKVRFLSMEPLLGPVSLFDISEGVLRGTAVVVDGGVTLSTPDNPREGYDSSYSGIHWAIIGGESGSNARPFHVDWCRDIIAQCKACDVSVFVKQMGANPKMSGTSEVRIALKLADSKGGDITEWAEDLQIRELPC